MIKIADFYMLCKWENLQNRQYIYSIYIIESIVLNSFEQKSLFCQ